MSLFRPALLVLGYLLLGFAVMMLVPIWVYPTEHAPFMMASLVTSVAALPALWLGRIATTSHITSRQVFLVTVSSWFLVPAFGALPMILGGHVGVVDSIFESVSGITTTGSTVLQNLDGMAPTILLWRSILQWLGGIGIIGMAAAVLPLLKVGGMRLFRTESSDWSEKAMPRARQIVKMLLWSYVLLSIACATSYRVAGMDWVNAINHSMTTISTGGFSTSDASMGQFHSSPILWISTLFMALGGMPFVLYARFLSGPDPRIFNDDQIIAFIKVLAAASVMLAVYLIWKDGMAPVDAITHAAFNVTSIVTTTGFASGDYSAWGAFAIAMFFFLTMIGGCSGSTAGGMKIFRFQLCFIFLHDHLTRLIHPNVVIAKRYNGRPLPDDIVTSAVAFSFLFFVTLATSTLVLASLDIDLVTSISASATALTNVGPGLGDIIGPAGNFSTLPASAKLLLCGIMIFGRLELLTVLVVLTPGYWRG